MRFTHLTNQDGLSQSTVQAILKDKYGFIWFGTQDGLNRYDGYSFKVYRHQPKDHRSLRRSNITTLYEDRQGVLWVGTSNGALSKYDRNRDSFIHYKESNGNFTGLSQKTVTAIYEDKQHNFWIGTYWKLNLLDRETGKITQFGYDSSNVSSISNDGVTAIFEDSQNNLWIGTSSGLNLFNRKTKKFIRYLHSDTRLNSISHNYITAIREDNRGRLWIGTGDGLNLFNPHTGSFTCFKNDPLNSGSIADNRITAIENERDGKLWIGTGSTLEFFDTDDNVFTHFTSHPDEPTTLHRNASIMSMLRDKDGILWVGTYQGGINKYDKHLTYFDVFRSKPSDEQSLSFNTITSFAENRNGDIWIGTAGGALNLWRRPGNKFIRYRPNVDNKSSLSSWAILCLYQSKKSDYLWIGTYGSSVDRYDPKTNTFKHYTNGNATDQVNNNAVYAIFEDSRGNIWMGTNGGGVNVLNPSTGLITKYMLDQNNANSVSGNYVRCFYEDKKGKIWIGTTSGLNAFDPRTSSFTRYDQTNTALESDVIFSIYEDSKGNFWVGTLGGGLNLLNPKTKNFTMYTVTDGLPDNTINSILEDEKGYLWLSTNNGISRFDTDKRSFKNSSLLNGIQSLEFSQGAGLKTRKGDILFGGVNGFNIFHPSQLKENENIPPTVITSFKLFNKIVSADDTNSPLKKDITETQELILSYDQSMISFEFAALGFTASEKNIYAFKLEGFDKKWDTGYQRTVTYTNLDAGEYILKIKAANNDGVWNEKATTLKIIITPPFWETWWFKLLIALLITTGAITFYKIRVSSIHAHKILLEKQVMERTKSLASMTESERKARHDADKANLELEKKNKELEQFVYIASHDLREPLRTTSGFIDLFQRQYKGRLDEKADTYLSYITQASERMRTLINDLLAYSRLGANKELTPVDCNAILKEVLTDLGVALTESNATVTFGCLPVLNGHPTAIKQLFQNLVANGIKFRKKDVAPAINVYAEEQDGFWRLAVADNGIGIQKQYSDRIFAIFQRLHTRKEYEGSGIGLAHCKKIVELHNGAIWVESEPGEGSTFYFTIQKNKNEAAG